jgi:HD-like signal output (HDOD) protein
VNSDTKLEVDSWIKRITESEMPIFGRTVQEVVSVSEDDVSSALQLGQVVLKDAAMTARVLKLANSAHYNATGQKFSTISRAIMMLGFDTVRSMCLTVSLIDSLVHGIHRDQLIKQMARSLHAASQAQEIAKQHTEGKHEEVFIATLLLHIGDLAFWCFGDEKGEELNEVLQNTKLSPEEAQKEVLGFSMNELSQGLAHTWGLSDLLKQTLETPELSDPRTQAITLSHKLAIAVEDGWDSKEVAKITTSISKLTKSTPKETTAQLHDAAKKAAETTAYYGAKAVARVIPLPVDIQLDDDHALAEAFVQPDPLLQLQILQELMSIEKGQANLNILVEMTLEGINRGVGMDNALFALLTPNRKELKVKQLIGDNSDWLRKNFKFNLNEPSSRVLLHSLKEEIPIRVDEDSDSEIKRLVNQSLTQKTKTKSFFIAPVIIKNKPIGLFYADRSSSHRNLDDASYDSFLLFSQQVGMLINKVMGNK